MTNLMSNIATLLVFAVIVGGTLFYNQISRKILGGDRERKRDFFKVLNEIRKGVGKQKPGEEQKTRDEQKAEEEVKYKTEAQQNAEASVSVTPPKRSEPSGTRSLDGLVVQIKMPDMAKVESIFLDKFPLTIGRLADCDVVLNDTFVSHHAATISKKDDGFGNVTFVIEDVRGRCSLMVKGKNGGLEKANCIEFSCGPVLLGIGMSKLRIHCKQAEINLEENAFGEEFLGKTRVKEAADGAVSQDEHVIYRCS